MIYIIQLKDDHPSDFNLLCKVDAQSEEEAISKATIANPESFFSESPELYQVFTLGELTDCFYDDACPTCGDKCGGQNAYGLVNKKENLL